MSAPVLEALPADPRVARYTYGPLFVIVPRADGGPSPGLVEEVAAHARRHPEGAHLLVIPVAGLRMLSAEDRAAVAQVMRESGRLTRRKVILASEQGFFASFILSFSSQFMRELSDLHVTRTPDDAAIRLADVMQIPATDVRDMIDEVLARARG